MTNRKDFDAIREGLNVLAIHLDMDDPFGSLSALDRLQARAAAYEQVAKTADALVPFLDANEVVPERERAALLNALYDVGLGKPQ